MKGNFLKDSLRTSCPRAILKFVFIWNLKGGGGGGWVSGAGGACGGGGGGVGFRQLAGPPPSPPSLGSRKLNCSWYMNPFFSPGKQNGDPILVINSDSWESHFLSGEKKTGAGSEPWPGLAQAGLSGEKKRIAQIGPDPGSGPALAVQQEKQKHIETIGEKYSGTC